MNPSLALSLLTFLDALTNLANEAKGALSAPPPEQGPGPVFPEPGETADAYRARGGEPGPIPGDAVFKGWTVASEG